MGNLSRLRSRRNVVRGGKMLCPSDARLLDRFLLQFFAAPFIFRSTFFFSALAGRRRARIQSSPADGDEINQIVGEISRKVAKCRSTENTLRRGAQAELMPVEKPIGGRDEIMPDDKTPRRATGEKLVFIDEIVNWLRYKRERSIAFDEHIYQSHSIVHLIASICFPLIHTAESD